MRFYDDLCLDTAPPASIGQQVAGQPVPGLPWHKISEKFLQQMGVDDPLLEIAKRLEEIALSDPYFIERNLYPNVDFYNGIILRAIGIPTNMFTVLFAIGRLPGWIAHWCEQNSDPETRISRPRQIYTGTALIK